jgi:hypothetical protein
MEAIVDVEIGEIAFLPVSISGNVRLDPVKFHPDSNLILICGERNADGVDGDHYYVFDGNNFTYLKNIPAPFRPEENYRLDEQTPSRASR